MFEGIVFQFVDYQKMKNVHYSEGDMSKYNHKLSDIVQKILLIVERARTSYIVIQGHTNTLPKSRSYNLRIHNQ